MTIVVDASTAVATLVDSGTDGDWVAEAIGARELAAPDRMLIEAVNVLHRASLVGVITAGSASLAHGDLLELRVDLWPYGPLAGRCWQLRDSVTI